MNEDKLLAILKQLDRKKRLSKLMDENIALQALEMSAVPMSIVASAHTEEMKENDGYAASIDLGICSIVCDDSGKLYETTAR